MIRYRRYLVLSIVFLIAALILPTVALYTSLTGSFQEAVKVLPDYSANNPQTGGIDSFVQTQTAAQNQLVAIVIGVEAVLAAAFGVTLMYAIRCRDQCRNFPNPT